MAARLKALLSSRRSSGSSIHKVDPPLSRTPSISTAQTTPASPASPLSTQNKSIQKPPSVSSSSNSGWTGPQAPPKPHPSPTPPSHPGHSTHPSHSSHQGHISPPHPHPQQQQQQQQQQPYPGPAGPPFVPSPQMPLPPLNTNGGYPPQYNHTQGGYPPTSGAPQYPPPAGMPGYPPHGPPPGQAPVNTGLQMYGRPQPPVEVDGATRNKTQLIVGIDFGTTFSGVSFAFISGNGAKVEESVITEWPGAGNQTKSKVCITTSFQSFILLLTSTFSGRGRVTSSASDLVSLSHPIYLLTSFLYIADPHGSVLRQQPKGRRLGLRCS